MSNINVGVLLKLSDQFSPNMTKALNATKNFSAGFKGAMNKIDSALNSMTGKLAMLGVSIGAAATINNMIKFEDRINKIKTIAKSNASSIEDWKKQTAGLGDEIYKVATLPDIKLNADEFVDAVDIIMTKAGDITFARSNLENMGRAMRATGASGAEIGAMFAEFAKYNYTAEETEKLVADMYAMGNKGAFTAQEFARLAPAIISAYAPIGTSSKDIKNATGAMQILMMQTKNSDVATTKLTSTMRELTNPKVQEKLKSLGKKIGVDLNVRKANGEMKDFNEILFNIVKSKDKLGGNFDSFSQIFGSAEALDVIRAYDANGHKLKDILDTSNSLDVYEDAAKDNAESLAANLQLLQTAFNKFAHSNLAPVLKQITNILNKFAKNPERFEILFKTLAVGLGLVFTVKTVSMINQTVSSLKNMFGLGGKNIQIPGVSGGGTSGSGIPVFVTNLGGNGMPGTNAINQNGMNMPGAGKIPKTGGNVLQNIRGGATSVLFNRGLMTKLGMAGALTGALTSIPMAVSEWQAANNDANLTDKEKRKQKGGAVGNSVGTIVGTAGGVMAGAATSAAVGAAIGSIVPGLGTAIGAVAGGIVGMGMAYFGGKIGRSIGENIADATSKDNETSSEPIQFEPTQAEITGDAKVAVDVKITDERIKANIRETKNDINNVKFQTGTLEIEGCYINSY